jgi:hypothetical protein
MEEKERGGVVAHLPTVKVAGGLHGVGDIGMSAGGGSQLGQLGRAGADGLDGKVGRVVVMAGFSVYAFRNCRHTWAGHQWLVLA